MVGGSKTADIPRFCDFADERKRLEGTKLKIAEIVNQEIRVTGFTVEPSKYAKENPGSKERLMLEFIIEGEKHILFTGSEVLIAQIQKYQDKVPFYTTIKHIDRYYTFS
ncbi:MAG: hypothetical protein WC343_04925 [Bacilli bacterium]